MGKWKKWLSAGLFTAMLGTAIIAGPTADVSANAGNKPYNIENVSPDAHLAPSVGRSSKTVSQRHGTKLTSLPQWKWKESRRSHYQRYGCLRMAGKDQLEGSQERSGFCLCAYFPMKPDIWMIIMPII